MLKAIEILRNGVELMVKAIESNPPLITHFENEIREYDLAINELEELENRSCESCNKYKHSLWDDFSYYCEDSVECTSNVRSLFCCNRYEKRKLNEKN